MASLITPQFEQYIAQQTINKGTVIFDEFIFANIPGLTADNLQNYLTMPQASQIVHRQAVSQSGVINENAVVYSVTIGTEIGDFDFNFIGLVNKSKNMLAVAVQTNPTKKTRNKNNVQGNSITRNVLLEFTGAKALTNINVTAQTWQIDFTVRLHGIDEKIRLTNRDLYGRAVFFDDSFLVKRKSGNNYTIEPGVAYVEGVRANMSALENINAASLPCSIYLDVVHHCTVTGAYETEIEFLKVSKADYTDTTNRPHYVQILADIDSNGVVTDRRLLSPLLGITPLDLDDTTPSKTDKRGHTHRLPLASLIKRGIVKLYSGYDSDAEDLAATPKAIKTLKAFIDAITRNMTNYIPNSKKSNAINSNSSDTVATSVAVKTAYDKAAAAEDNANGRVSKEGDTMSGNLAIKNGTDWAQIKLYNKAGRELRFESLPDTERNCVKLSYRSADGNQEYAYALLPKRSGTIAFAEEVIARVVGNFTYATQADGNFVVYENGKPKYHFQEIYNRLDTILNKDGSVEMTGNLQIRSGDWSSLQTYNTKGQSVRWEITPSGNEDFARITGVNEKNTITNSVFFPRKTGTVALLDDIRSEKLIWQGSTTQGLTLNIGVDKGLLLFLFKYRDRLVWNTVSIAHCNETYIGFTEYGGENADKDHSHIIKIYRNGTTLRIDRGLEIRKIILLGG